MLTTSAILSSARRALLSAFMIALTAGGLNVPASAAAPFQKSQSQSFFRTKVGDLEVTALYDGGGELNSSLLHADMKDMAALLKKDFSEPDHIKGAVAGFLVNTGTNLVLVDTGTGGQWGGPTLGKLVRNLRASGYKPEQVDLVLVTHLHADHAGGIRSPQGKRVFPNAEVRMAKADSDFWLSETIAAQAPKDFQVFFKVARDSAAPYIAAGKWHPFEGAEELAPGVRAVPITGHTPGHTGYEFTSKGQKLLVWGDVVHVAAIQLPRPDIGIDYDADGPAAIEARKQLFTTLADSGTVVAGAHMPFPSLGRLRKDGAGYVWVPVPYTDTP